MNYVGKISLLTFGCLLFFILLLAQRGFKTVEDYDLSTSKPFIVKLDIKKSNRLSTSHFKNIFVIDNRMDTSMVGYVYIDIKQGWRKICLPLNVQDYLNKELKDIFIEDSGDKTLIIQLNDLWFNETITQAGWMEGTLLGNEKLISTCFLNVTCYIKDKDSVKEIGGLDTTFVKKGWLPNNCDALLTKSFIETITFAEKKSYIRYTGVIAGLSNEQQNVLPNTDPKPPILRSLKPSPGIYFSFQDFLNNNASKTPFAIKEFIHSYKLTYHFPSGQTYDSAWGFSDGENVYMHLDSNYYRMKRVNNYFEVLAPETIEIINVFSQKAVHATMWYFAYENPFKIFSLKPFLDGRVQRITRHKFYHLNLLNGRLR